MSADVEKTPQDAILTAYHEHWFSGNVGRDVLPRSLNLLCASHDLPIPIKNGFPLQFSTEASVDLADEPELMELMVQANFRQVFVGLESPRTASLAETHKHQNVRGDSLLAKVRRIRDAGLVVIAGFIVGFDSDDIDIFDEQRRFIGASGIAQASVTVLSPLPTTPLYDRLEREGRLDSSDPEVAFVPAQMTQRQLREGHTALVRALYEPEAYLERVFTGYCESRAFRRRRARLEREIGGTNLGARLLRQIGGLRIAARLAGTLAHEGLLRRLAGVYVRFYARNLVLGADAIPLDRYVMLCILHWHFFKMARHHRKTSFGNPMLEARAGAAPFEELAS